QRYLIANLRLLPAGRKERLAQTSSAIQILDKIIRELEGARLFQFPLPLCILERGRELVVKKECELPVDGIEELGQIGNRSPAGVGEWETGLESVGFGIYLLAPATLYLLVAAAIEHRANVAERLLQQSRCIPGCRR